MYKGFFCVGLYAVFIYICVLYYHWECCIQNTDNWHFQLCYHCTIGPGQAKPSLLIGVVLSLRTDMWGAVTNTGYDGMPSSLGIVQTLIHSLGRRSAADKLHSTSQCSSVSVTDITDSATSPALRFFLQLTKESFMSFPLLLSFHYSIYFGSLIHEITSLCV